MTTVLDHPRAATPPAAPRPRRSVGTFLADRLLDALMLLGALCIGLVIAAYAFHISVVMFKTGSMAPSIPTGSVALVREVPAKNLHVGDVVTVDRSDELPITHRILSISELPGGRRSVDLKGDANPTPDPTPYEIDHARVVLWSHPGGGYLVARLQNPMAMTVTTLVMSAAVTWAFWPRRRRVSQITGNDSFTSGNEDPNPGSHTVAPAPDTPGEP